MLGGLRSLSSFAALSVRAPSPLGSTEARSLPGGVTTREHRLSVPLNYASPADAKIDLFVREVVKTDKKNDQLPYLLFLQGGPGFPSPRVGSPPSGWMRAAIDKYRVLLLDQRGTGQSSPASCQVLRAMDSPASQAAYLACFRADSIVRDCEAVRAKLARGSKLSLLGQSFGGFVILSYLSLYPDAIERALFTFGLAPVGVDIDEVYAATFKRMEMRNARYYRRYPEDVELIRSLVRRLDEAPEPLPRGGTLTARRFLQLGLLLGSASGFESLHDLLELARVPTSPPAPRASRASEPPTPGLPENFLLAVENAQAGFETNPLYWLLHESIYCDGPGKASRWSAERVQASLGAAWDHTTRLAVGDAPVQLTGEMVYSWMCEDYAWLRPLGRAAQLLAEKADWPALYDETALRSGAAPCAALVSYDDIYVERAFSERTVALLGDGRCRAWVTNEFQHSGLRDDPSVFDKLVAMSKGELNIPS